MVDTKHMVNISDLASFDLAYVDELIASSKYALKFIDSQKWCKQVIDVKFDRGWGYIMSVFFLTIDPTHKEIPEHLWVIVGDLPPAYIDVEDNPNGACAINGYVMEMEKWVHNVLRGEPVDKLIPVNAPPIKKYAKMLRSRLNIIKKDILSKFEDELGACHS